MKKQFEEENVSVHNSENFESFQESLKNSGHPSERYFNKKDLKPSDLLFVEIFEQIFSDKILETLCKITNDYHKMNSKQAFTQHIQRMIDIEVMINEKMEEYQKMGSKMSGKFYVQENWREDIDNAEEVSSNYDIPEKFQKQFRLTFLKNLFIHIS